MAPSSDADEPNDVAPPDPLTEDTTVTKKRSLNSSTGTLTPPFFSSTRTLTPPSTSYSIGTLTSLSSSSIITLRNSLHIPPPPFPTLPFELIVEIISKLPVKSLMQFQCVSKSWKSLISNPKFAKKHLHMSTKHHHLISTFADSDPYEFIHMAYPLSSIFTEATVTEMQLEYPLINRFHFDPIVGSCHGILCILDYHFVILWNPSIKKFTTLPCFEVKSSQVFDFSFGYDHSSDSYKVVAFFSCEFVINGNRDRKILVKINTLGTDSWRRIQDFPTRSFCEDSSGKFVCGTINWLTFRRDRNPTSLWCIISLDLEKESYLEIKQPDYGGVTLTSLKLGVLRDCLCIFSRSDTFTDIWFMKEYGNKESWIKLFCVHDIRDLGSYLYVCALYVSEDDRVLMDIQSELVVYNSRDGTFKDLNIRNPNGVTGTIVYQESLISPCF